MAKLYIQEALSVRKVVKPYRNIIRWLAQSYGDDYYIFLDTQIPGGREADILVLQKYGAWYIEVKNYEFVEVRVGAFWKYRNRQGEVVEHIKEVQGEPENPYMQAINTANSFRDWVKDYRDSLFTRSLDLKQFEVFPCVLAPSNTEPSVKEPHPWCYFYTEPEQLKHNIKRVWKRVPPHEKTLWLESDEITSMINQLGLREVELEELLAVGVMIDVSSITRTRGRRPETLGKILDFMFHKLGTYDQEQLLLGLRQKGETVRPHQIKNALEKGLKYEVFEIAPDGLYQPSSLARALFARGQSAEMIVNDLIDIETHRANVEEHGHIYSVLLGETPEARASIFERPIITQTQKELPPPLRLYESSHTLQPERTHFPTMFRKGGVLWEDLEAGYIASWADPEGNNTLSESIVQLLIQDGKNMVVVGPPASGKSTLTRTIAYKLTKKGIPSVIIPVNEVDREISSRILEYPKEKSLVVILEDLHLTPPDNLEWIWQLLTSTKKERSIKFLLTSRVLKDLHPDYPFDELIIKKDWGKRIDLATLGIYEQVTKTVEQFLRLFALHIDNHRRQQLAQKITKRNDSNLLFIAYELCAYVEKFLPQLMVDNSINFGQVSEIAEEAIDTLFSHLESESFFKVQRRVNAQIIQDLDRKTHKIASKTGVLRSVIQKILLTLATCSEWETPVNARAISKLWNISTESVALVLNVLEKDLQEICRTGLDYEFSHPKQASRYLQAIEDDDDDWATLIVEFRDMYKIRGFQAGLLAVAQDQAQTLDEFLMWDDARRLFHQDQGLDGIPPVQLSMDRIMALAHEATAGELNEFIRKYMNGLHTLQTRLALWDALGVPDLTNIVINAESVGSAIYFLQIVWESGWNDCNQLLDSIGVLGFANLLEANGFTSAAALLAHFGKWSWEKTSLFQGEIFIRSLHADWTDSSKFYQNLASRPNWASILESIDREYVYKAIQENSDLHLPSLLEFLDKQAPKLANALTQRILEDGSQTFPISHLVHCMRFVPEQRKWSIQEFLRNLKHPILKKNLLRSNMVILEWFLEKYYENTPEACAQLLADLSAREIADLFDYEDLHAHANLLFTLKKVHWPYMNELLDLLGLDYFVEFIRDSNESHATPHVLEFLFQLRWDDLPRLLTELNPWFLSLDPAHYWAAHLFEVVAKHKIPETEELVHTLTQRYVMEGSKDQLQNFIRALSEGNWPWKSWIDPSIIQDALQSKNLRAAVSLRFKLKVLIEEEVPAAEMIAKVLFQHYLKEGVWLGLTDFLKPITKMGWDWRSWVKIEDLENLLAKDLLRGTLTLRTLHELGWVVSQKIYNNLDPQDVAHRAVKGKALEQGSWESIATLYQLGWDDGLDALKYLADRLLEQGDLQWLWELLETVKKLGKEPCKLILPVLDDARLYTHLLVADPQYGPLLMGELLAISPTKAIDLLSRLLDRFSTFPPKLRQTWHWHWLKKAPQSLDQNVLVARMLDNRAFGILPQLPSDWGPYLEKQIRVLGATQLASLFLHSARGKRDWLCASYLLNLLDAEEAKEYSQELVRAILEQGIVQDIRILLTDLEEPMQKRMAQHLKQIDPKLVTQFILRSELSPLTEFLIIIQEMDLSTAQTFVQSCSTDNWIKILSMAPRIEGRWFLSILRSLVPSLATAIISELQNVQEPVESSDYELDMALFDDNLEDQDD